MLSVPEIDAIAARAAAEVLGGVAEVARVETREIVDQYGDEAVEIAIVFSRGSGGAVGPDHRFGMARSIRDGLTAGGDNRFPFLRYAAVEELEPADSAEC
jgi:hypothetical protein